MSLLTDKSLGVMSIRWAWVESRRILPRLPWGAAFGFVMVVLTATGRKSWTRGIIS